MAKYRVIAKTFINNEIIDPDTMPEHKCIVEYDGIPGSTLELLEGEPAQAAGEDEGGDEVKAPKKKWAPKAKAASDDAA